ncbi:hypothetical protein BD310DRAFT_943167 [Dichomitus squalens]|uniref:Uncharacterized protein n=1 Tax=Dichomitus squalens TaxID=114155 RepID=A0A4Q9QCW6_9APHY|nr:hypothetical protein BD310DRAFT_943167 [Dichomitus squalens]
MLPPSNYSYAASHAAAGAGSASNPIHIDSPPKPKRARKTKVPNAPVPEKRGAMFKKVCPKNIIERAVRVRDQRFYMIDRRRQGNELREEFSVLGSTGNVYNVVIDKKPSCTCPDALKGNHCKHILFIFLKVLQVSQKSGHWYQKALLTSELEDIFARAPRDPAAVAHERIQKAYAQATGKNVASGSQKIKRRLPGKEDMCPVCFEDMEGVDEKTLTFCDECGNGLHKDCFQQWMNTQINQGKPVTCMFCRAKWNVPAVAGQGRAGRAQISEGYLNLSAAAGINPVRDTSSYYHGPTRGRRYYGYQDYF